MKNAYWRKKKIRRRHEYQFFVSHVTEDKEDIVYPVLKDLDRLGLKYFIDTSCVKWGTILHRSLSKGLNRSRFFLAFISEEYVLRNWTMWELDIAIHRQITSGADFILPVIIGNKIQRDHIMTQIPFLANTIHLVWEGNASKIAIALAERIKKIKQI